MIEESIVSATPTQFWLASLLVLIIGIYCGYRSFRNLRQSRIIEDTPTSKIRSAAQGYTELEGSAELLEGAPIVAPLTGTHCVWYSAKVEERGARTIDWGGIDFTTIWDWSNFFQWRDLGENWSTIRNITSDSIFQLNDETGKCIVDPEGADVNPTTTNIWYGHTPHPVVGPKPKRNKWLSLFNNYPYRYTEKRIHCGEPVYAIGMFLTLGANHHNEDIASEIRDLLTEWKRNKSSLLQRFDLNMDGQIDLREWEIVRKAARKTVEKSRKDDVKKPPTHVTRKPRDPALPFLLSAVPQHGLTGRKRRRAIAFIMAFLISVVVIAWGFHLRFLQNI